MKLFRLFRHKKHGEPLYKFIPIVTTDEQATIGNDEVIANELSVKSSEDHD
jgi:hypothetical protein